MARISGKVTKVLFVPLPPEGEVLAMEGKQVWYGTPDGLGSGTMTDITAHFKLVPLGLSSSEESDRG